MGFHQVLFTIQEITNGYALGVDNFNVTRKIPVQVQRAKGAAPLPGEQWVITKDLGPWTFAAIMNNPITNIVESVVAGDGISVNDDDPLNPIVTNTGVYSVVAGTNVTVDDTDPHNPIVSAMGGGGGGISEIDSPNSTISITNDTGPTTDIDVANPLNLYSSSTGGHLELVADDVYGTQPEGYVSLTGASEGITATAVLLAMSTGTKPYAALRMSQNDSGASFLLAGDDPTENVYEYSASSMIWSAESESFWSTITTDRGGNPTVFLAPGYLGITTGEPSLSPTWAYGAMMSDTDGSLWIFTSSGWNHIT